jgi:hypothetical protein
MLLGRSRLVRRLGKAPVLYHFDRKFTNSENLLAEMADKFSFEF